MKRWPARVLAAVSLLLAVGIGVLWVRSYNTYEGFGTLSELPNGASLDHNVLSHHGSIAFYRVTRTKPFHPNSNWTSVREHDGELWLTLRGQWEFAINSHPFPTTTSSHVKIPHWFAEILALSLSLPWLISRQQRAKARRLAQDNKCPACGYDLRATPNRCPECGRNTNA